MRAPIGTRRLNRGGRPPGGRRAAVWGAMVATLLTVLVLLASAGSAGAAPEPPLPGTPATSSAPPDEAQEPGQQHNEDAPETAGEEKRQTEEKRAQKRTKQRAFDKRVEKYRAFLKQRGALLSAFKVTDEHGIPVTVFEPDPDTGDTWDIPAKIEGMAITWLFAATVWTVAFACWLLVWALSWSLASILLRPAQEISHALYAQSVLQMGIPSVALAFSGVVATWHVFFGRRQRGWGELTASTLISALAATTLLAPPSMLLSERDGAVGQFRTLGLTVAAIVVGDEDTVRDATDARALTRPLTDRIVDTFIVQPSMLLTYGRTFSGSCAAEYAESRVAQVAWDQAKDQLVEELFSDSGAGGQAKERQAAINDLLTGSNSTSAITALRISPSRWLNAQAEQWAMDKYGTTSPAESFEKKCMAGQNASEAKKASPDRAFAALFVLFAALLVVVLVCAQSLSYLAAQGVLAAEAMFAKVVLVAGILPGPGRALLWQRAVNVARLLGLLVALVVLLAVSVVVISAVLGASGDQIPGGLTARFFVVDLLVITAFKYRKKLVHKSRSLAAEARGRLGSTRFGGTPPAHFDQGGERNNGAGKLAATGMMLGALAGGGAMGALHSPQMARGALGARLAAGGVRGGARLARGGVRTAGRLGRFGLRYTVGAPVNIPRAGHAALAGARALPPRLAAAWNRPDRRQWRATWTRNTGLHALRNRWRIHRGLPPVHHHGNPAPAPVGRHPAGGAPAAVPPRPRRVPHVANPPAGPAQAALRRARARAGNRYRGPVRRGGHIPPPPPAPPVPPRPAPRRGPGGRHRGPGGGQGRP
ncbi:hypothetical protein [Streptomyces cacaoi]|uniref:hypothetical protein n=1 Tax=Streptomyces cacaoi TaxID=1898 RepID=UPI0011F369DF|nr:hypothetical protein [Streptomyces cacaoi]